MRHLLGPCAAAVVVLFGSWGREAQGQTPPPDPRRVPPPAVTAYYANPVSNFYQRQRELREQATLQRDINQLQKTTIANARKKADPAKTDAPKTPTSSVTYNDKKPASSAAAKTDPMKRADTGKEKTETPPMPRTDGSAPPKGDTEPKKSKTFSNYAKLLRK